VERNTEDILEEFEQFKTVTFAKFASFHYHIKRVLVEEDTSRSELILERNRLKKELESLQKTATMQKDKHRLKLEHEQEKRKQVEQELKQAKKDLKRSLEKVVELKKHKKLNNGMKKLLKQTSYKADDKPDDMNQKMEKSVSISEHDRKNLLNKLFEKMLVSQKEFQEMSVIFRMELNNINAEKSSHVEKSEIRRELSSDNIVNIGEKDETGSLSSHKSDDVGITDEEDETDPHHEKSGTNGKVKSKRSEKSSNWNLRLKASKKKPSDTSPKK